MKTDNYAKVADTEELIRIGKLPTALLLAGHLEKTMQSPLHGKAADELRRLHAANIDCIDHFEAIKAERDALLAALKYHQEQTRPIQQTIDAIAKAEAA